MPRQHLHAAFERTGRDGGDVVDEALRGDLRELHTHVTTAGDDVLAVHAPDRVEHPVTMTAHEERFLARRDVNRPHRIVTAAKREVFAIRRPTRAIQRVKGQRFGEFEFLRRHIPDLDFAHARRTAARDGDFLPIRRPCELLNAFRQSDETRHDAAAVRLVHQHLMITRHGDLRAIRRVFQRGDRRSLHILRRMRHVVLRLCRGRGVIVRAFIDPALDQRDLRLMQRIRLLRHLRLALFVRFDQLQQVRLRRLPRHDRMPFLASFEQRHELRHHVIALVLRRLVAAIALRLKNRADVFIE